MPDGVEAKAQAAPFALPQINISVYQLLLGGVLIAAFLTRFVRLGTPGEFYFDETYFPRTAQEIYRNDPAAWQFYGHENTHPPLSKEFMAGAMKIFKVADDIAPPLVPGVGGLENPYAWRFFGALAGVGSVLFIYLLARRLFDSEIAGLAAAFILTCEGVVFAQSRIATPDTFVLFFMLGCVYFLVTDRFLFSGVFFGAALACKYVASLTAVPIVLYLVWKLITRLREQAREERMQWFEIALPAGIALLYMGLAFVLVGFLGRTPDIKPGLFDGLGAADYAGWLLVSMAGGSIVAGVAGLVKQRMQAGGTGTLLTPQGRTCLEIVL
ncbi:MAG: phospholipid carrier-dependent glycosyltransferase, partial [Chloroflexi bacterium]